MRFIVASNNKKKIEELERILKPLGITPVTVDELGKEPIEVEETGETFKDNAELKAEAVCKETGLPTIADDSGLMVDALGGRPGVYSGRYADTDNEKIEKLLGELMTSGNDDRTAHFVCVICCCFPNGEKIFAYGQCDGTIGYAPRGTNGFGYDPIFFIEGNKTFAEMTDTQKDAVSHRGKALRSLSEQLIKKYSK